MHANYFSSPAQTHKLCFYLKINYYSETKHLSGYTLSVLCLHTFFTDTPEVLRQRLTEYGTMSASSFSTFRFIYKPHI